LVFRASAAPICHRIGPGLGVAGVIDRRRKVVFLCIALARNERFVEIKRARGYDAKRNGNPGASNSK
jgi:hypothetical protein